MASSMYAQSMHAIIMYVRDVGLSVGGGEERRKRGVYFHYFVYRLGNSGG